MRNQLVDGLAEACEISLREAGKLRQVAMTAGRDIQIVNEPKMRPINIGMTARRRRNPRPQTGSENYAHDTVTEPGCVLT